MQTPSLDPTSPTAATAQTIDRNKQELSVVCHDIQLSSARRHTPYTAAKQARVLIDQPDNPSQRRTCFFLYVVALILRFAASPIYILKDTRIHPTIRPLLAPTGWFRIILLPLIASQAVLGASCLVKTTTQGMKPDDGRYYSSTQKWPLVILYMGVGVIENVWVWLMTYGADGTVTACFVLALLDVCCSFALLRIAKRVRKDNLSGIWHLPTRLNVRLKDFWLLELPFSVQFSWSSAILVMTFGYWRMYSKKWTEYTNGRPQDDAEFDPDTLMLREQVFTTTTMFAGVALFTVLGFAFKRRANPIAPLFAVWVCLDWSLGLADRQFDLTISPNLNVVDPLVWCPGLENACLLCIAIYGCMAVGSFLLHINTNVKRHKQAKATDGTYSFIGGPGATKSTLKMASSAYDPTTNRLARRPSEFMILRADSSSSSSSTGTKTGASDEKPSSTRPVRWDRTPNVRR